MHLLLYITFLSSIYCVTSKNNVKSLSEAMGQEVIEIGTPLKDLPPGLEEEPSAENEDDEKYVSNTILPATKKDIKKTTTMPETRRKSKDSDKMDGASQDDEEARIEKELAEIYKDTADYKADSAESNKDKEDEVKDKEDEVKDKEDEVKNKEDEVKDDVKNKGDEVTVSTTTVNEENKPIARQRPSFKFQPDINNRADVERFRTSIDEISCDKRVTQKLSVKPETAGQPIISSERAEIADEPHESDLDEPADQVIDEPAAPATPAAPVAPASPASSATNPIIELTYLFLTTFVAMCY